MIYTCYEMIRDCQANRAEGWRYFVRQYVPVVRKLLSRYGAAEDRLQPLLTALHESQANLFQVLEPAPERPFVAELRQRVLAGMNLPKPARELDLDSVSTALGPLTLVEKQAAWLEGMRYTPAESGEMLRMSAGTVEKIRGRAAELIRGQVDTWNASLLAENGPELGRSAAAGHTADCPQAKIFLDVLDGRATWQDRGEMDRHVTKCWHCIDHFSRLLEVVELLRVNRSLTEEEAAPFDALLGIPREKRSPWKRIFSA
jgi:hypothetical protein